MADKLGVVIYTYDRVDDARISQELIRQWDTGGLGDPHIVHSYNGAREWYPKKHQEDTLIRRTNPGHFEGAADLIDAGIKKLSDTGVTYGVVLAADTWLLDAVYVTKLVAEMEQANLRVASADWGHAGRTNPVDVGLATDFFIIDIPWAIRYGALPFRYRDFNDKHGEYLLYRSGSNVSVEKLFMTRILQASFKETPTNLRRRDIALGKIRLMDERSPVHLNQDWERKAEWPRLSLYTYHEPAPKKVLLRKMKVSGGPAVSKLLAAKDLAYYNNGTSQHGFKVG